jgi:hypothetical protein
MLTRPSLACPYSQQLACKAAGFRSAKCEAPSSCVRRSSPCAAELLLRTPPMQRRRARLRWSLLLRMRRSPCIPLSADERPRFPALFSGPLDALITITIISRIAGSPPLPALRPATCSTRRAIRGARLPRRDPPRQVVVLRCPVRDAGTAEGARCVASAPPALSPANTDVQMPFDVHGARVCARSSCVLVEVTLHPVTLLSVASCLGLHSFAPPPRAFVHLSAASAYCCNAFASYSTSRSDFAVCRRSLL